MTTHVLERHRNALICLALIVLTLIPFWQVRHHQFVNYDDNEYVYENPNVTQGLTVRTIVWAFVGRHVAHWHPVASLSHLLDVSLFGLKPGGHHTVNLLLHVANTVVLFLALVRMTHQPWRSAVVALLFALHPLHVEPVAWVSSRKDVLSTLFLMLTLLTYARYVERPTAWQYLLVLLSVTLGLMAKVMLVTLPFALLLLDYWPLARLTNIAGLAKRRVLWKLVREKLPLFIPVAMALGIAFHSAIQHGIAGAGNYFPLHVRLANSLVAYGQYVVRTFWPAGLAAFYPHPGSAVPLWQVIGSTALLACVSVAVWRLRRRHPYLAVGWLWFLGTLVPVIGLVQSVHFATADKYTYVPLVGLFIMVVWGVADAAGPWCARGASHMCRAVLGVAAAGVLLALTTLSWVQAGHWCNSETLARHTVSVTSNNAQMHNNLGLALAEQGKLDEAAVHFNQAIRIRDYYVKAHYNLGVTLAKQGKLNEAIEQYAKAIEVDPDDPDAHYNLGNALERRGQVDEAIVQFEHAVRLHPDHADAHYNLGNVFNEQGRLDEAIDQFAEVIRIDPGYGEAYNNLGLALARQGRYQDAVGRFAEAIRIDPRNAEAYNNLGAALVRQGKLKEAEEQYLRALQIDPKHATARRNLERIRTERQRNP